jgi:hypothetical protein
VTTIGLLHVGVYFLNLETLFLETPLVRELVRAVTVHMQSAGDGMGGDGGTALSKEGQTGKEGGQQQQQQQQQQVSQDEEDEEMVGTARPTKRMRIYDSDDDGENGEAGLEDDGAVDTGGAVALLRQLCGGPPQ